MAHSSIKQRTAIQNLIDESLFSSLETLDTVRLHPIGGTKYIFSWEGKPEKESDWRSDGYKFKQQGSAYKISFEAGEGMKFYSYGYLDIDGQAVISDTLKKHAYYHPAFPQRVLLVYEGNFDVAVRSKRSANSLLRKLESGTNTPRADYHKVNSEVPAERQVVDAPKNVAQIKNLRNYLRKKMKISECAFYTLFMLAYDWGGLFIRKLIFYPDTEIVCVHQKTVNLFQDLLNNYVDGLPHIPLHYDTTYTHGDFYVSTVSFRHVGLEGENLFVLGSLVHDRLFAATHQTLFASLGDIIPELNDPIKAARLYMITDHDKAAVKAWREAFPLISHHLCIVHIKKNVMDRLKHLSTTDADQQWKDLMKLFHSLSRDAYTTALHDKYLNRMSKSFEVYYLANLNKYIDQIGVWNLRKHGVTTLSDNNPAESVNAMLRRDANNKERLVDEMVILLYNLCARKHNEVIRAAHGTGEFKLKKCVQNRYKSLVLPLELEALPSNVAELCTLLHPGEMKKQEDNVTQLDLDFEDDSKRDRDEGNLAHLLIKNNKVSFNVEHKRFIVAAPRGPLFVKLFPKPECTCGGVGGCYHVRACQMLLGMDPPQKGRGKKKSINTRVLVKNQRTKPDLTSGRKKPRSRDKNKEDYYELFNDLNGDRMGSDSDLEWENRKAQPSYEANSSHNVSSLAETKHSNINNKKEALMKRTSRDTVFNKQNSPHGARKEQEVAEKLCMDQPSGSNNFQCDTKSRETPIKNHIPREFETLKAGIEVQESNGKTTSIERDMSTRESFFSDWANRPDFSGVNKVKKSTLGCPDLNYGACKWEFEFLTPDSEFLKGTNILHSQLAVTQDASSKILEREEEVLDFLKKDRLTFQLKVESTECTNGDIEVLPIESFSETFPDDKLNVLPMIRLEETSDCESSLISSNFCSTINSQVKLRRKRKQVDYRSACSLREKDLFPLCSGDAKNLNKKKGTELKKLQEMFLCTSHINALLTLLRKQFADQLCDIGGLYNVHHGANAKFPPVKEKKFVQILHDGVCHWVLAVYGFFHYGNEVAIFDSNNEGHSPNQFVVASIASLLRTEKETITVTVVPCQQQRNGYDCGVYAVAFAWAVLSGHDPAQICFDPKTLRPHLHKCLKNEMFAPIPGCSKRKTIQRRKCLTDTHRVYCICRRPHPIFDDNRDFMAECTGCFEWFHRICVKIPKNVTELDTWKCCKCNNVDYFASVPSSLSLQLSDCDT